MMDMHQTATERAWARYTAPVDAASILLVNDGKTHTVQVVLGD